MLILFLDLETSGLNSYTDQVIEIAGVIIDLNKKDFSYKIVSQFDDLVKLRQKLDDKITRITGLSDLELETANPQSIVQENWYNWLLPFEKDIVAVVGHSINFDLGFLKNENWWLPENYKLIDTLDLAKIIYPYFSAVNLEFLVAKLELEVKGLSDEKMLPHRATFDTLCCVELFQKVLQNLVMINYPQSFYSYFKRYFLPLNLDFFDIKDIPQNLKTRSPKKTKEILKIDFSGQQISQNIVSELNQLGKPESLDALDSVMAIELPNHLSLVVAQFYVINFLQTLKNKWHYKFHAQGKNGSKFLQVLLDVLNPRIKIQNSQENQDAVLGQFENIITQIRSLSEIQYNITGLIEYLEIYRDIYSLINPTDKAILEIQKILSSYDFLLFNLQSFWQSGEYQYDPNRFFPEEKIIQNKFIEFCELLKKLRNSRFNEGSSVLENLSKKIIESLDSLEPLDTRKSYTFRIFGSTLTINIAKVNFDLENYLAESWKNFAKVEVQTYLNPEDFELLLSLAGLKKLFEDKKITISHLADFQNKVELINRSVSKESSPELVPLVDFYKEKLALAKSTEKPIIILGGQNSTLRDSQRVLTANFEVKDYLLLGESGSLTKIGSKLVRDYVGLVVIKINDFNFLLKLLDLPEFEEIWIVNQPFFWVHKYWQNLSKHSSESEYFLFSLKRIYVQAQANYFGNQVKKKIFFLRAYIQ